MESLATSIGSFGGGFMPHCENPKYFLCYVTLDDDDNDDDNNVNNNNNIIYYITLLYYYYLRLLHNI